MKLLGKPTDADLLTFPHVLLTGPHVWDQSVVDYTHPTTAGNPPQTPPPPPGPLIPPNAVHMPQD